MKRVGVMAWLLVFLGVVIAFRAEGSPTVRAGRDNVLVGPKEEIRDDFYGAGSSVVVQGKITGDLMAAGKDITSKGEIGGDMLAAGQDIKIGGKVGGNVRAAAQTLELEGAVGKAVTAFASQMMVRPEATVGSNLLFAGRTLEMAGKVEGNLRAAGEKVVISGPIKGNLEVSAQSLELLPGAEVGGKLKYRGPNPPSISPEAVVRGEQDIVLEEREPRYGLGEALRDWLKVMVLAALLSLLASPFLMAVEGEWVQRFWTVLGAGALWTVFLPLIIFICLLLGITQTLGWLFLGLYLLFLWGAVLLFKPLLGAWIGRKMFPQWEGHWGTSLLATLLGTTLVWLLSLVPFLNAIIFLVGLLMVVGSWLLLLGRYLLSWPRAS